MHTVKFVFCTKVRKSFKNVKCVRLNLNFTVDSLREMILYSRRARMGHTRCVDTLAGSLRVSNIN